MRQIEIEYYKSPIGEMILGSFEDKLCLADWRYRAKREAIDKRICDGLNATYYESRSKIVDEAINQLEDYFKKKIKVFDLPLLLVGTDFQKQVWSILEDIPFGQTRSYLELAKEFGDVNSIRAVAAANGANAISIIIPCHRIIGNDGSLVGYAGGLKAKEYLLQLEGTFVDDQLSLFD